MNIIFTIKALLSLSFVFFSNMYIIYNSSFSFTHGVQNMFGLPSLPCRNVQFAQAYFTPWYGFTHCIGSTDFNACSFNISNNTLTTTPFSFDAFDTSLFSITSSSKLNNMISLKPIGQFDGLLFHEIGPVFVLLIPSPMPAIW